MAESEIWKALPGVTGVEVSTLGRVRTLDRVVPCRGNGTRIVKGRILKPFGSGRGYMKLTIKVDGKFITKSVHRLVARTFLPNSKNLPQVNHKDCNRANNNVGNLEWCTASYNRRYREKYGVSSAEAKGRPVFAINLTTNEVSHFRSQKEAGRALGIFQTSINMVIRGKQKQAGGFWFVNDDGHAVDAVKSKLHDIGKTKLKIKHRAVN